MKVSGQGWNSQNVAARHEELFAKLDRDGDKKITKDEMKTAMSERSRGAGRAEGAPSLDEIFQDADGDGDGAITQAEFQASLEKRLEHAPKYDKSGGITVSSRESRALGVA
jgi:Ca2+-binding EF-hand superfamily protein